MSSSISQVTQTTWLTFIRLTGRLTPLTESRITIQVRSTEIDINGHVNNAKYLEYFEWGREDLYECLDLPYTYLLSQNIITVTVNININYRKEAIQNDQLTVISRPDKLGNTSFTMEQTIIRESDQAVIADAYVTLVTVDAKSRKKITVPDLIRKHYQVS